MAAIAGLAVGGDASPEAAGGPAGRGASPKVGRRRKPAEPPAAAGNERADQAYGVRLEAARRERQQPAPDQATNGDEESLPRWIACYSKGLPHDRLAEVDDSSYRLLLAAIRSGDPREFERVPLGGQVKLANPQGALAFNLVGPDSAQVGMPPPPRFASPEQASELVELYWHALARDVPFSDYPDHPLIARAAADLSRLVEFQGPRAEGAVTPATIFRGLDAGPLAGPYVSQFLYHDVPLTPVRVEQRLRTAVAGLDYLTRWDDWVACENGGLAGVNRFDDRRHYLRNGRDLGESVHRDFTYQAPLTAGLILFKIGAPGDGGNPYQHSRTQSGFVTFGQSSLLYLLATVTQAALAVGWYQKWAVHRRVRPEEYAARVEVRRLGRADYPIPPEVLASDALEAVVARHGGALLPMAYPEGCPTHPSYPAGHSVIAGACVTVLKAFFDESYVFPQPVVPSPDGLSLRPWKGPPLSVGGELDKLAWNVGIARDFAGLHWRSDTAGGLRLGEAVAERVLAEVAITGNEIFSGFSFTRFDGSRTTI